MEHQLNKGDVYPNDAISFSLFLIFITMTALQVPASYRAAKRNESDYDYRYLSSRPQLHLLNCFFFVAV